MAGKSIGSGRVGRRGPAGGIAEQGRRWVNGNTVTSRGKNAHVGWAPHSGAWGRCYKLMYPHLGKRAAGYCQRRMHDSLGIFSGSRANRGSGKGSRIRK